MKIGSSSININYCNEKLMRKMEVKMCMYADLHFASLPLTDKSSLLENDKYYGIAVVLLQFLSFSNLKMC